MNVIEYLYILVQYHGGNTMSEHNLAALLDPLSSHEGETGTSLRGVRLLRVTHSAPRQPIIYKPQIIIVGQGQKIGYLNDQIFTYDKNNYLVLSIQLPFECETATEDGKPYLAISIDIDLQILHELILTLDDHPELQKSIACVHAHPLSPELMNATIRLVKTLSSLRESKILGPQILREILYRTLTGPAGDMLRALSARHTNFSRIARVIEDIHTHYEAPLDINSMAESANMSVSAFHHHFKEISSTSPIQYVKRIRLHKARLLISQDRYNTGVAAQKVGYTSTSQFSREYKRFFGESPTGK